MLVKTNHSLLGKHIYTSITHKIMIQNPDEFVLEDAIDYEDARDVIADKYPNRKVLAVIGKNK